MKGRPDIAHKFTFPQKYFDFKTKYLKFADEIIGLSICFQNMEAQ